MAATIPTNGGCTADLLAGIGDSEVSWPNAENSTTAPNAENSTTAPNAENSTTASNSLAGGEGGEPPSEICYHYTRASLQNLGGNSHTMSQQMASRLGAAAGLTAMSDMDNTVISTSMRMRETLYALQAFVAGKLTRGSMMFTDMAYFITDDRPFALDMRGRVMAQVVHANSPSIGSMNEQTRMALKIDPSGFVIRVFSSIAPLAELIAFVDDLTVTHITSMRNQLGSQLFVFEQLPAAHMDNFMMQSDSGRRKALENARFAFSMKPFKTTTTLDNIYGSHLEDFRARFKRFHEEPEWFRAHGQKRCLGVLLYGPPGTGKTTLIKAVANTTQRHPFVLRITKYTTISELEEFFYSPLIEVRLRGAANAQTTSQILQIPLAQRLVIMEDVDAMAGHLFLKRTDLNLVTLKHDEHGEVTGVSAATTAPEPPKQQPPRRMRAMGFDPSSLLASAEASLGGPRFTHSPYSTGESLNRAPPAQTLDSCLGEYMSYFPDKSYLMNVFDGITELNQFLLIMSSNMPWMIDSAFLRPGRTDALVHIAYAKADMVSRMFAKFFDMHIDGLTCTDPATQATYCFDTFDKMATPADINAVCHRFMNRPHEAFALLMSPGIHLEGTHVEEVEKYRRQQRRDEQRREREQAAMMHAIDAESVDDPVTHNAAPNAAPNTATNAVPNAVPDDDETPPISPLAVTTLPSAQLPSDSFQFGYH